MDSVRLTQFQSTLVLNLILEKYAPVVGLEYPAGKITDEKALRRFLGLKRVKGPSVWERISFEIFRYTIDADSKLLTTSGIVEEIDRKYKRYLDENLSQMKSSRRRLLRFCINSVWISVQIC